MDKVGPSIIRFTYYAVINKIQLTNIGNTI